MNHLRIFSGTLLTLFMTLGFTSCLPKSEPQEVKLPSLNFGFLVADEANNDLFSDKLPHHLDPDKMTVTIQGKKVGVYTQKEFAELARSGNVKPKEAPMPRSVGPVETAPRTSNPILYGAFIEKVSIPSGSSSSLQAGEFHRLMIGQYDGEKNHPDETIIIDWGDGGPRTVMHFSYKVSRDGEQIRLQNEITIDGKKLNDQDPNQVFEGHIIIRRSAHP